MQIPQVVGAVDGTHVEILCPDSESRVDYFSRKQKYTINTQAVVGSDLIFLDVVTGFSTAVIMMLVFLEAPHYTTEAENWDILNLPQQSIDGYMVRPLLLGDGAYPATTWAIKPYSYHLMLVFLEALSDSEKKFNKNLFIRQE